MYFLELFVESIKLALDVMSPAAFCILRHTWQMEAIRNSEKVEKLQLIRSLQDERSKSWRVQAVSLAPDRFESRKALPEKWRGMRDDELFKETGIPGCVFIHMSGFLGGNKTYEGALEMARAALKC